jgi:AcrR family transcriptional regulator/ABC-type branched-subunit amino acid transport system substrate-binding protein
MTDDSPEGLEAGLAEGAAVAMTDSGDAMGRRVLATAAALFRTKGYAQSTTRELAGMLGLKKASLYYYVESKEGLLYSISIESLQQIDGDVAAAIATSAPADVLRDLIKAHICSALGNRDHHAVMLGELRSLSEPRRREVIKSRDAYEARVRGVIAREQAEHRLRSDIDSKYLTLSLLNLLNWTIFWYQPGGPMEPEQVAHLLATIFIEGASPPKAATRLANKRLAKRRVAMKAGSDGGRGRLTHNSDSGLGPRIARRDLFRYAGAAGLIAAASPVIAACSSGAGSAAGLTSESGGKSVSLAELRQLLNFDPAYSAAGQTYNIGAILPLTGTGSFYGEVMTHGIDLAVKHIKQLGGPAFAMNIKDNQSGNAVAGVSALRELNGSGIDMFVSSYIADEYALLPGIQQYKMFALEIGEQEVTPQVQAIPYYWSGIEALGGINPLLYKYIQVTKPHVKRLSYVSIELGTTIDNAGVAAARQWASKFGMDIANIQFIPYGTTDFSGVLSKLSNTKFDALINVVTPGAGLFMRQYLQAGFSEPNYASNLLPSDVAVGGSAMTGMTVAGLLFDPDSAQLSPFGRFFRDAWYKSYGKKPLYPEAYGATAYDVMFQFWQLIQEALRRKMPVNSQTLNSIAGGHTVKSVFGGTPDTIATWHWDPSTHFPTGEQLGVYTLNGSAQTLQQVAVAGSDGVTGFSVLKS